MHNNILSLPQREVALEGFERVGDVVCLPQIIWSGPENRVEEAKNELTARGYRGVRVVDDYPRRGA